MLWLGLRSFWERRHFLPLSTWPDSDWLFLFFSVFWSHIAPLWISWNCAEQLKEITDFRIYAQQATEIVYILIILIGTSHHIIALFIWARNVKDNQRMKKVAKNLIFSISEHCLIRHFIDHRCWNRCWENRTSLDNILYDISRFLDINKVKIRNRKGIYKEMALYWREWIHSIF